MKNVHWLVPYKINQLDDVFKQNIASLRMRTGLFTHPIFKSYRITFDESISNINNINFLFISPLPENRKDLFDKWSGYIESERDKGKIIYFEYLDNHLSYETLAGKFYRAVLKENDRMITSSESLKSSLISKFKNVSIIEDPIEIEIQKIKYNQNNNFLFFGHQSNLKYLLNLIPNWDSSKEYNLIIQTSEIGLEMIQEQSRFIKKPNNLNIQLEQWSIPNMLKAAELVSGIIIPGDITDNRKNGVSHNRLITAFALGLPVAATRYKSYLEFDNHFADIDNHHEFKNFLLNPNLYSSRVKIAQNKVKSFTKETLASKWLKLLKDTNSVN
jgi:hypothetical protein